MPEALPVRRNAYVKSAELGISIDKLVDRQSALCRWDQGYTKISSTFARFALPMLWDFCEGSPLSETTGNYMSCVEWVAEVVESSSAACASSAQPKVSRGSALSFSESRLFEVVVTSLRD